MTTTRSRRAALAHRLGCMTFAVLLPSWMLAHAAAAEPRSVTRVSSASLLPAWARTYDITGTRQVWLLPVYDTGQPEWDAASLLTDVNAELSWFHEASHGKVTLTATQVLKPLRFDSGRGSACDAAARVLAPAISRFYSEAPPDAYLVALTRSTDCPYAAIGDTPGRSLILTGFSDSSQASDHSLLHELGHNLGLPHSSGYTGALLSSTSAPSSLGTDVLEYGALTDVMGGFGASFRLSAASLAALGWGEGVIDVPSDTPGTYAVRLPEVSSSGPDAVVVDDPISGIRYSLTYINAPTQTGPGVPVSGRGVFLHEVRRGSAVPTDYGRSSFSYWMPWEGHSTGGSMGIGAGPGTSWLSPTGAVAVTVRDRGLSAARLTVQVDPAGGLADVTGPAWPLAPRIRTSPGSAVATLQLPAAWDQSGVTSYRVTATGAQVLSLRLPQDLVFPGGATIALTGNRATVTVVATDGAGNTTTWSKIVRTSPR